MTRAEKFNLLDFVKEHFGRTAPHAETVSYVGKDISLNYSIESFPREIVLNPV